MRDGQCTLTESCSMHNGHRPPCLPYGRPTTLLPAERPVALTGEVGPTRVPVDIPSGAQGLVIGPDEVLVLAFAVDLNPREMRALRAELETKLPPARFIIAAGYNAHIAKMQGTIKTDRGEIDSGVLRASLPPSGM